MSYDFMGGKERCELIQYDAPGGTKCLTKIEV